MNIQNFDKERINTLINNILNVKWPKSESEIEIFKFFFSNIHFFKTFLRIGNAECISKVTGF
jgi:hypothetical protein